MIDRTSRNQLAEHLRQLSAGTITLCEFDRRIDFAIRDSEDRCVQSVLETAFEIIDPESMPFALTRFRGRHRLPDKIRRQMVIATTFTFFQTRCVASRVHVHWGARQRDLGRDYEVWSFVATEDFERQISTPKLLSGA